MMGASSREPLQTEMAGRVVGAGPSPGGAKKTCGPLLAPLRYLLGINSFGLIVVTAVVATVFSLWHPREFATLSNLQNMTRQGAVLAIVAMGQMFPLLVGGFDISVGALMGVASVVGVEVMIRHGLIAGVLAGIATAAGLGLVNGILIARFRISAFVVTLGMLSFARGLALQITGGTSIFGVPESFEWLGARDLGGLPTTVLIALIVAVFVAMILWLSRAGLYFYAIGSNEDASRLAGIKVVRYKALAYVLSGLMAGIAGLVLSSRVISGQPTLGQGFELQSIAVAVIGGVAIGGGEGTLLGVFLGVLFMSLLTSGLDIAQVSPFIQQMVMGLIIVLAVLWDRFRYGDWRVARSFKR